MVIRCDGVIRPPHVLRVVPELASLKPTEIRQASLGNFGIQLINKEKQRFQKAIIEANGDREKAAVKLGIPRSTFYRRAKELGIGRSRRQRSLQLD